VKGWAEGLVVGLSEQKAPGAAVQGDPVSFLTLALLGWGEAVAGAGAVGAPEGVAGRLARALALGHCVAASESEGAADALASSQERDGGGEGEAVAQEMALLQAVTLLMDEEEKEVVAEGSRLADAAVRGLGVVLIVAVEVLAVFGVHTAAVPQITLMLPQVTVPEKPAKLTEAPETLQVAEAPVLSLMA
jgi:hypothetical protein